MRSQASISPPREAGARFRWIAALTAEVGRLAEQVATSNDRITELVAIAQRKSRKSRASSVVPSTPKVPKDISEDAKAAFEKRPRPPELPPKKKPTPKKQKPTGRKPLPEHLEAETHELTPTVCASCGNVHLDMVDVIVETKLHVVKEHIRRRVVYRKTGRCRACGERTTPRSLPAPFPRSQSHLRLVSLARLYALRALSSPRSATPRYGPARYSFSDELSGESA